MSVNFDYNKAFCRNLGWITESEFQLIRDSRVALAGLGGVGGSHLITLARMGVGKVCIADFDIYGIENFNRQYGAQMSTIGLSKLEVMKKIVLDINPEMDIRVFSEGINEENMDYFLKDVDVFLDGLDVYAIHIRQKIFNRCNELNIPAVTAGPIGMGTSVMTFLPGQMSFEKYFGLSNYSTEEKVLRFLLGLTPSIMQGKYLVDSRYVNLKDHKTASTPMGCMLASGVAVTEVLKLILKRGPLLSAPWSLHFDSYLHKYKKKFLLGGFKNPIYQIMLYIARKKYL